MFEDMVVSSPHPSKTNKPWTVVVSMIAQTIFLAILILIPLIYTEALPKTMMATMLTAPPPPPPPPPPPVQTQIVHVKPQVHLMDAGKLVQPKVIPKDIKIIKEDAPDVNGGAVQAAKLVNKVQPVYPPLARQTRISGTVRLHALISKSGSVESLEVISGHPLLVRAAMDAVQQWRYQPTLLNGEPVEVDTTIDVIFSLNQ